ncbi:apoptosis facilitator Bcl-2 14 [Labeo rohita]|uniref:Apoptosis facilitator Bcl-2-like protein 14 n=2 Tax=Labeo rohita TaxID=84645 RepID=A0ABQ8LJD5_LABRO|nr:uncharacterized protein LOC127154736 [Labeo rohita]KAI2649961.1 Apoptosis facilitator Bcl-2-like protein 14 [Labeo rohita]RXN18944.1 apoptosis facilitator Bcl-2 14 [Labeo rohita]
MSKLTFRNSQLLLSDQKCAKCLLETYVKRSLSLNEGSRKHQVKQLKWLKRGKQSRRASSDTSTHRLSIERLLKTNECPTCTTSEFVTRAETRKAPGRTKSFFRGFLHLFSKKKTDPKVKEEQVTETESGQEQGLRSSYKGSSGHGETLRKKHTLRRLFFTIQNDEKRESLQNDSPLVLDGVDELSDGSVDSNNTYFEKVSEELELIVKEIQFSPNEDSVPLSSAASVGDCSFSGDDTTERIISLLKQHGDIIDKKISRNKSVQDFLKKLSYSSFQQLADRYIAQIPSPLPQTTDASPDLVRLAFTLDFTAKVAGLCSQTVGRIMGFGYQYLQDSFTQMCAAHRQVPGDLEEQNTSDPD